MRIQLAEAKALDVAERWRAQYQNEDKTWRSTVTGDTEIVYNKLLMCPNDPDQIAAIVGNKSWTHTYCNGCSEYVKVSVIYGEDTKLCRNCLASGSTAIMAVHEALYE